MNAIAKEPLFADIAGKVALVTGASGGLGLHFARVLAAHGATVVLAARRKDALENACRSIEAEGGKVSHVTMDVTDRMSIEDALDAVPSGRADILVNNAGISGAALSMDLKEEDWDSAISTNLRGVFLTAQAAARRMRAAGTEGSIINISSILATRGYPGLSAYAASKAAVSHLTRTLALEWARFNIRVNALCPGFIETDITRAFLATPAGKALISRIPQRRLGRPADLDVPLLMLASGRGSYMTGSSIVVDGGHVVSSL